MVTYLVVSTLWQSYTSVSVPSIEEAEVSVANIGGEVNTQIVLRVERGKVKMGDIRVVKDGTIYTPILTEVGDGDGVIEVGERVILEVPVKGCFSVVHPHFKLKVCK